MGPTGRLHIIEPYLPGKPETPMPNWLLIVVLVLQITANALEIANKQKT